jgi:5-methyltetrahydropteroyltriglutamate--homocysteine methyltransferase
MKIKTTHVGSLPRPVEMNTKVFKKEPITKVALRSYLSAVMERQMASGITYINNGELPREDYVSSTISRIKGFSDRCAAPIPQDMVELPEYSRRFGSRNGLITLNPKAPVKLPVCKAPLAYTGENSLRQELDMMTEVFNDLKQSYPHSQSQLFFTSPSPGTIALFMENKHYPGYEAYIEAIGEVMRQEYEIISSYGIQLQIDCPDLAMGRHTKFKDLTDEDFLAVAHANVAILNDALVQVDTKTCRAHICWGNYPGTHHCDIELKKIFDLVMKVDAKFISLESSNHRHAHEWELFKDHFFPEDKVLMPGVIDTATNIVEHPRLVAQRISNYASLLGPDRVIGSTDCGFASTASAASVTGEVAWLKLHSLVAGAEIAGQTITS